MTRKITSILSVIEKEVAFYMEPKALNEGVTKKAAREYTLDFPRQIDKLVQNGGSRGISLSHMYELNQAGNPTSRLFKIIQSGNGVAVAIKPSKNLVPLSTEAKTPGIRKNKKMVKVTKRYRFPARPFIYEFGKPVIIRRKTAKFLFIPHTRNNQPFHRGPVRYIPSGNHKFALRTETVSYFKTRGRMIMNEKARKYGHNTSRAVLRAVHAGAMRS